MIKTPRMLVAEEVPSSLKWPGWEKAFWDLPCHESAALLRLDDAGRRLLNELLMKLYDLSPHRGGKL